MGLRLLLVDEIDEARRVLAGRLSRSVGIAHVDAVSEPAAAIPQIVLSSYDATLLNVDGHQRGGPVIALCRELSTVVAAPLFLLTSFMGSTEWIDLRRVGAAGFFLKHIDTEGLVCDLAERVAQFRGNQD
jgi:DNA-binding NarL/FixJ family response regulator